MYISKFVTPEIIFGSGSINQVGESCHRLGASRIFLVADKGVIEYGWVEKPIHKRIKAGLPYLVGFTANPKDFEIEEGAALYLREQCDAVLAIGGGSAIDAAGGKPF